MQHLVLEDTFRKHAGILPPRKMAQSVCMAALKCPLLGLGLATTVLVGMYIHTQYYTTLQVKVDCAYMYAVAYVTTM